MNVFCILGDCKNRYLIHETLRIHVYTERANVIPAVILDYLWGVDYYELIVAERLEFQQYMVLFPFAIRCTHHTH